MEKKAIETFCPVDRLQWREWLQKHHRTKASIWLIYYRKKTNLSTLTWSDAVDEALCFGWIDSTSKPIDDEKFMQFFTRRKTNSVWSKINKGKVQRLIDEGLMMPAGLESIEVAKQNGSWAILDDVEELKIPKDLEKAFKSQHGAKACFERLSRSVKKAMLYRLVLAKRPETREQRIADIMTSLAEQLKPPRKKTKK
ncbi:YdeI/OmpD-associated family protein [Chitinophaga filiformis]|uniref:YdeI/OmpD-associated family protein n=1 Tax=Chitinophaga filiformis TaxID=104663 RepID=A0ABY4I2Z3_CHIFI|nr:YdeI/OmpD-associated family protein [Chitinophaga filiformis]UPK69488.1 YdeI/OmpD-associated family protein [Chitinophaga filiformis]